MSDDRVAFALAWRGIETPCSRCSGSGGYLYGGGSTWRGGAGGAVMTHDVCDLCWGSGDAARAWTNLRALEEKHRAARARNALDELAAKLALRTWRAGADELVRVLEGIESGALGRGKIHRAGRDLVGAISDVLRAALADTSTGIRVEKT